MATLETATPTSTRRLTAAQRISAYIELTKPGIVRMVVLTAGAGFFLASTIGHPLSIPLLLHTLFGTALAASGACGLNEYVEWEADSRMGRTSSRPIPSGRISPRAGLVFSTAIILLGLLHLELFVDSISAALVALTVVSYVFVYTPMKRTTWIATLVGAVPGALPILVGWVAGGGGMTARGFALFLILFLWQMPHFYALGWIYRRDYERGGFRLLTSGDADGRKTGRQTVLFCALLLLASLLPTRLDLTGGIYFASAIVLGAVFLGLGIVMAVRRDDRSAIRLFMGSVVYLPLLLLAMVIDRLIA